MFNALRSHFAFRGGRVPGRSLPWMLGGLVAIALSGCETTSTAQYDATATATYTWVVEYTTPGTDKFPRPETFESTRLVNRNGQRPEEAVTGPDDQGLWWPALPPRPTVDQMEARIQQPQERPSSPQIQKSVDYRVTIPQDGQSVTLPTNAQVYRQVAKAYPDQTPLLFTLGVDNQSVEKAEPGSAAGP